METTGCKVAGIDFSAQPLGRVRCEVGSHEVDGGIVALKRRLWSAESCELQSLLRLHVRLRAPTEIRYNLLTLRWVKQRDRCNPLLPAKFPVNVAESKSKIGWCMWVLP
jgi:hypothetical protein